MSTNDNLMAGFAGESQARNKYMFYAKVAMKEGYNYIAEIFEKTASNEVQHAKEQFKLLKGINDTKTNLKAAIEGEHYETSEMYPNFAKQAREEGNGTAEKLFMTIAKVEKEHEERFKKLLELLENDSVFKREKEIKWTCSKCGHVHTGTEPPKECPCCKHEYNYFLPEDIRME